MNQVQQIILGSLGVIIINIMISALGIYIALQTYMTGIFPVAVLIVAAIGIVQLLYVMPIIIWLRRRQQFALVKGVIIGAVITALVNGACYLQFLIPR